jgi:subtilisin-like proprotein convertase family protein
VDALAAVRLAETWSITPHTAANREQITLTRNVTKIITDGGGIGAVAGAFDSIAVTDSIDVERVEVTLNVTHPYIGDLSVLLTSPSGTTSFLLWRPQQNALSAYGSTQNNINFTFNTVLDWGESSVGTWLLGIYDYAYGDVGTFDSWTLNLIGKPSSADDIYIYTNEFSEAAADQLVRSTLNDVDGTDTLNASAVTSNLVLNLGAGGVSTIDGRSLTMALGTVIENAYGGDGNDVINGSSITNVLYGMRGNDTLDGGTGADQMFGGSGDDTYWVDNIGDVVTEVASDGSDLVASWISYTLPTNLESLILQGTSPIGAVGNMLDNILWGNGAANSIDGGSGDDVMYGGLGNDIFDWDPTLRGGNDTIYGGLGNDTYVISGGDQIIELSSEGIDTIWVGQNYSLVPLLYVENLSLFGTLSSALTGNGGANTLRGNSADNLIDGQTGNDTIDGGAGVDTTIFSQSFDKYTFTSITTGWVISGPDGSDTLGAMEFAQFSDKTVALSNFLPTGSVTLNGTPAQGQTLTVANNLSDLDGIPASGSGAIVYQWKADGIPINGATGSTLVLSQLQVGQAISVMAAYIDGHTNAETVTSSATAAVVNVNDAPTGNVTLTGFAIQGQTLSAANTLADLDGVPNSDAGAIKYQWLADGEAIGSATTSTLVLTQAQVGKAISVKASYTDLFGAAESMTSSPTTTVVNDNDAPTGTVTLSGTATQGQTLTAANTLADMDGIPNSGAGAITYQWLADGVAIGSTTSSTLLLTQAQVGKAISVKASYSDLFGRAESVTSSVTALVTNVNDEPTGTFTPTGVATQGQTLTAANTLADLDGIPSTGAGAITYQWLADGVAIGSATSSTLALTQAEVGKAITVAASYIDTFGAAESMTSSATAVVTNVNDLPTGIITVSGLATQGQTLTAANTLADLDGLGIISYQWSAGGVTISGATTSALALTHAEVGKAITVLASYLDTFGTAESKVSSATTAVGNVNDLPTGTVTLTGVATQGQTLTAANTLADLDGIPSTGTGVITYQWLAGGEVIGSATSSILVLTQSQVGKAISVKGSYTDLFGAAESMTSNATAVVTNVNDLLTGSVTITGAATQGQTLTATNTLADVDGIPSTGAGAITYQWLADGVPIGSATSSILVLTQAHAGKAISVTASYTDLFGAAESMTSSATTVVANANDAPAGTVTISGSATQGQTLTAANTLADLDGIPTTGTGAIAYQWLADGVAIGSAISSTLVLTQAQVGKAISVNASYTDLFGGAESMTSSATAVVTNVNDLPTGTVTLTGVATQGQTLTAANTLADLDGLPTTGTGAIAYQWLADGVAIGSATSSTLVLTQAHVGKAISVAASYTDLFGAAESMTNSATTAVGNVNDLPTGTVTLTGVATQGQTLTAANTLSDVDGLGIISYQWSAGGVAIGGATANTFVITPTQAGKAITVTASYTDGQGTAESVTSSAMAVPANTLVNVLAYSWKAHTLLSDVSVSNGPLSHVTAGDGAINFEVMPVVTQMLTATRAVPSAEANLTSSAVNLQDAIAILKMIVGLDVNGAGKPLSPYQALAADYDGNGAVQLTDAIGVLKHVVGLTAPQPTWHFVNELDTTVPGKATLSPGQPQTSISANTSGSSPVHVGLVGYLSGDVDGSFAGAAGALDLDALQSGYFTSLAAASGLNLTQFGVYAATP